MKIAVLGTGSVGRTLAGRLVELGHEVRLGTRDPSETGARPDWRAPAGAVLVSYADAAHAADLIVHAGNGRAALAILEAAGAENLAGRVVMDVSNPLDFSGGFPPSLFVANTDSLAEMIQRAFPQAKVVKALNTLTASLMVAPGSLPESSTTFVAGTDEAAKTLVKRLLQELGHDDLIDLGGIDAARGMEAWLLLWLRVMGSLGTPLFNLKIVRSQPSPSA